MSWSAATDNVGVTGYALYLNGTKVGTTTGTSYTYTGLTCGTAYTVGLEAFDAAGNASNLTLATGPAATSACTPTADTQAPSSPGNLALGAVSQTSVSVSWSASSDNVGVAGYGYYRGGSLVGNGRGRASCSRASRAEPATHSPSTPTTRPGTAPARARSRRRRMPVRRLRLLLRHPRSRAAPTSGWTRTAAPARDRQAQARTQTRRRVPGARPIRRAQTGDLILVRGGNYGDVKIGPNKASIAAPGVTFRTASGEIRRRSDFENGPISGSGGGNNISFVGPVTARTFRTDRTNNIVVDGWNVDCAAVSSVQIFHLEAANNVVVRNSEIQDNNDNSLIWINGTNLTFENNVIHDAGLRSGSGAHTECMYVWRSPT